MGVVNLTPHAIGIIADGETINVPASGTIARVETREELTGELIPVAFMDAASGYLTPVPDFGTEPLNVAVVRRTTGGITGLPEPVPGTIYIVSGMVRDELGSSRPDVFAPDTGDTAIRNERGHVAAVTRLIGAK